MGVPEGRFKRKGFFFIDSCSLHLLHSLTNSGALAMRITGLGKEGKVRSLRTEHKRGDDEHGPGLVPGKKSKMCERGCHV